jgi:hypothetical protein
VTCEQRAPDFVSADRVLRIAVSFPSVFGTGFASLLVHGDYDAGRHDLTMIGIEFLAGHQNSPATKIVRGFDAEQAILPRVRSGEGA